MNAASIAMPPRVARDRTAPEVVDAAIQLVRQHYVTCVTVTAICFAPLVLLAPVIAPLPSLVTNVVTTICGGYAEACLILGLAAAYRGEELPSAGALLRAGGHNAGRVIRITLARSAATVIGLLFLIVPGLFAYAYYLLASPAAVLEDLAVRPAIKRGAALAKGEYRRLVVIGGLCGLMYIALLFTSFFLAGTLTTSVVLMSLIGAALQIVLAPVLVAIMTLLYFDVRERREGLDIALALGGADTMLAGELVA